MIKIQNAKIEIIIIIAALLLSWIAGYCIAEGAICLIGLLEKEELPKQRILVAVPIERSQGEHSPDSE